MQQYPNIQELPASSANVPIQQFQLLQQQRSPGFGGYGTTFITPHPSLMYATRDVAFYPSALTASDYNLPYTVQQPEKQVPVSAAEPAASKPEPAPPPPKAPRTSKKNNDKSGSTYASRHQAAESRRRQRINDRLDTLRKVVPHRDRANTAAFLEEVISYVVGLKKRVADLEGVSEDKINVPQVDVGGMLGGVPANGGAATVLGNPTIPTATANTAETMQLAMLDGMGGQPMPVSGPIMAGMPFQDAAAAPDLTKGLPARGMPTPALNANQVLVPVALMPDQPNGGQAYMLVNRDEFPMMGGQPPFLGMQPAPEVAQPKPADEDGLMDVLVGAAVQVEEGDNEVDTEGTDNGDEEGGAKSMTTRSGRKRNPTQRMF